jgi:hypothetical protein
MTPFDTQDYISAEELFGATSTLVSQGETLADCGISSLGTIYQIVTGIIALLFIFTLVKYLPMFSYLITASLNFGRGRVDLHVISSEARNIEIFTSIAGLSLLALTVMRLIVLPEINPHYVAEYSFSPWLIGGVSLAATFLLILCERGALYLIGLVSGNANACKDIWHIKLLYFSTTIILLTPLLILALLTEGLIAKIALYCSVAVCSISLILFIKETFLLFRAQRFSIFHWILYLCALEIFPVSLLLAPVLRGGF